MHKDRQVAVEINHLLAFDPTSYRLEKSEGALATSLLLGPARPKKKTRNRQLSLISVPSPAPPLITGDQEF